MTIFVQAHTGLAETEQKTLSLLRRTPCMRQQGAVPMSRSSESHHFILLHSASWDWPALTMDGPRNWGKTVEPDFTAPC